MIKSTLILLNKKQWLSHAAEVIRLRGMKNDDELIKEILSFNFKFGLIPDKPQDFSTRK